MDDCIIFCSESKKELDQGLEKIIELYKWVVTSGPSTGMGTMSQGVRTKSYDLQSCCQERLLL